MAKNQNIQEEPQMNGILRKYRKMWYLKKVFTLTTLTKNF